MTQEEEAVGVDATPFVFSFYPPVVSVESAFFPPSLLLLRRAIFVQAKALNKTGRRRRRGEKPGGREG